MNTASLTDETMPKKDFQQVQLKAVEHSGGMRLALNSFAELEKFAGFMALSNFVPKHLRGKQADCLAVLLQSMRWEMDPFAVAQKTYFVNDGMAYEAQLVNAIILSRAPIKARPHLEWSGEGENLKCKVSATFVGEEEPKVFEAELKPITTRNSPLWKQQPKQQLGYFASRAWARLYCPDVIMGVYTKEEVEQGAQHIGADNALDITPKNASALDDITSQIKAEKQAQQKRLPVEHVDPETGEVTDQAATDSSPPLSLQDWLEDIANIPTVEGVDMKYGLAAEQFHADATAMASLTLAKTQRKQQIAATKAEQTAEVGSGSKKLFEKAGAAA